MRIEFAQSGGFAGLRTNKSFDTNTMPADEAGELTSLVDAADFFNLPPELRSRGADQFQYKITVEKDAQSHTVESDERAMPPALVSLTNWLMARARRKAAG